jgi:pyruvate dehydrogenase E1 component
MTKSEQANPNTDELRILGELEKKILWLASWTIHNANHLRESADGLRSAAIRPRRPRWPPS